MVTSKRTRIPAPYIGIWALFMSIAVAYIAMVTMRPDLIEDAAPQFRLGSLLLEEDEQAVRAAAAETDALQRQLQAARAELNSIRSELARRTDRETTLALKLAAVEAREAKREAEAAEPIPAPVIMSPPPAEPVAPRAPEKQRQTRATPPPQQPPPVVATAPAPQVASAPTRPVPPRPPARAAPAPLETSSVASAPAAIQLGAGPSVDALRLNWMLLNQRHQVLLQKLQPRYMASRDPANPSGPAFDLIAGPVPSTAEAQRVCDALRAQNVACKVGTFAGNAL